MKSVLISIKPKWCELIANGQKTVEVRKTRPKLETPFKCYIYCTSSNVHECLMLSGNGAKLIHSINYKTAIPCGGYIGNGKVIGEFVCDDINTTDVVHGNEEVGWYVNNMYAVKGSCLAEHVILCYCPKESTIYGWHISDLVIYDEPEELSEFRKYISFLDGESTSELEEAGMSNIRIKRPPQSWCYVEERKMR